MIPTSIFIATVIIFGAFSLSLFFHLVSMYDKIEKEKDRGNQWKHEANIWYRKYNHTYDNYLAALKKSNPSNPTWRNIMGFSPESKPTKSQIDIRYKALAKVYHPDLGGSNYAMKLLNLAKEKADKSV